MICIKGWKIYVSNVTKSHEKVKHLTKHTKARTLQPRYSPSGNSLAYLAMDRPGYESDM
jgi:Tol biopolymer transport system component